MWIAILLSTCGLGDPNAPASTPRVCTVQMAARLIRAVRALASDQRIPRPLRWLVVAGALPIPGPVDEIVLLVAAVPLLLFYRPLMHEAWQGTRSL